MRQSPLKKHRSMLRLEELEPRLVLDNSLNVPVNETFGQQIVTIQAYGSRVGFGIFDTGAGAITFSMQDQSLFTSQGQPIPIAAYGGASAQGIGGAVVGDLSEPGTIWADGIHAANMTINAVGSPEFSPAFNSNSAQVPNLQVFVGTASSPYVPTITGTPILLPSPAHPGGLAAAVTLGGYTLNLGGIVPGLNESMHDISFVTPGGETLQPGPLSIGPFEVPVSLSTVGEPVISGAVTEAPVPILSDVAVTSANGSQAGQRFLLDTGAQLSVISPELAAVLGLDLQHPIMTATIEGIGGPVQVPGFYLKEIDVPDAGGTLRFMGAPVFVADMGQGLSGVLGMNVLDSAATMIYDPYNPAGPVLILSFSKGLIPNNPNPTPDSFTPPPGGGSKGPSLASSSPITLPFQSALNGTQLPLFQVDSGRISGQAFLDFNHNGVPDGSEPGIAGETVYLDLNHDGRFDPSDPWTTTDSNGRYEFAKLAPGNYSVRAIIPSDLTEIGVAATTTSAAVADNATTTGVNIAQDRLEPDRQIAFLAALYGDVLDRGPDLGGLSYFEQLLSQGVTRAQVAQMIWDSPEHRSMQIEQYYQGFLNRPADPGGLAYFLGLFAAGAGEQGVQLQFLISGEYQAAHASDSAYLGALYNNLLGRAIDPVGAMAWEQLLQNGTTRMQVGWDILNSDEFYLRMVDGYYALLLHRPADSGGQQAWLYLLDHQQITLEGVANALLGSQEYANWSSQLSIS